MFKVLRFQLTWLWLVLAFAFPYANFTQAARIEDSDKDFNDSLFGKIEGNHGLDNVNESSEPLMAFMHPSEHTSLVNPRFMQNKGSFLEHARSVVLDCDSMLTFKFVTRLKLLAKIPWASVDWGHEKKVGQGAFGCVWKFQKKECPLTGVMKLMTIPYGSNTTLYWETFRNERNVWSRLTSEYVVNMWGANFLDENLDSGEVVYFMENVEGGDLEKLQRRGGFKQAAPRDQVILSQILIDVLEGLNVIHANGYMHRDIKPANIFLTKSKRAKLGDFGFACSRDISCSDQAGTPSFMAPEAFDRKGQKSYFTRKSDIWAAGVTLYQLWEGKVLFKGSPKDVYKKHNIFKPEYIHKDDATLNSLYDHMLGDYKSRWYAKDLLPLARKWHKELGGLDTTSKPETTTRHNNCFYQRT